MRGGGRLLSSNLKGFTLAEGATHVAMLNSQRCFGFTLAEVLVTLGIIGVVSAMTVPSLMQNYQRQSYVTQLHKVYNELSQALVQYQTDKNAVNLTEAGLTTNDAAYNFFHKYFKVVKECESMNDCFADEYKSIQGSIVSSYNRAAKSFVLASGASIRVSYAPEGSNFKLLNVGIDVIGKKGPNILGRDFIFFAIYKNGLIDDYTNDVNDNAPLTKEARDNMFNTQCNAGAPANSWGCFGKILNDNWQMTY